MVPHLNLKTLIELKPLTYAIQPNHRRMVYGLSVCPSCLLSKNGNSRPLQYQPLFPPRLSPCHPNLPCGTCLRRAHVWISKFCRLKSNFPLVSVSSLTFRGCSNYPLLQRGDCVILTPIPNSLLLNINSLYLLDSPQIAQSSNCGDTMESVLPREHLHRWDLFTFSHPMVPDHAQQRNHCFPYSRQAMPGIMEPHTLAPRSPPINLIMLFALSQRRIPKNIWYVFGESHLGSCIDLLPHRAERPIYTRPMLSVFPPSLPVRTLRSSLQERLELTSLHLLLSLPAPNLLFFLTLRWGTICTFSPIWSVLYSPELGSLHDC